MAMPTAAIAVQHEDGCLAPAPQANCYWLNEDLIPAIPPSVTLLLWVRLIASCSKLPSLVHKARFCMRKNALWHSLDIENGLIAKNKAAQWRIDRCAAWLGKTI